MKKAALVVVLALADVIAAAIVFGRPADSQSETVVERMFRDDMKLSLERVDIPDAETILSAPVFRISYSLIASYEGALPGSNALSDDLNVWIKGDRLVPIFGLSYLSTDDSLDAFDGFINPAFRLNEGSADQFRSMLREVMGRDQFESVPVDATQNVGNTWYFLNGDFLSYYKGFVVTVDAEGAVTDLRFELSMLPKNE